MPEVLRFEWADKYMESLESTEGASAENIISSAQAAGLSRLQTVYLAEAWLLEESVKSKWFLSTVDLSSVAVRNLIIDICTLRDLGFYYFVSPEVPADKRKEAASKQAIDAIKGFWRLSAEEKKAEKAEYERFRRAFNSWKQKQEREQQKKYSTVPNGKQARQTLEIVGCAEHAEDLVFRKKRVTHSTGMTSTTDAAGGKIFTYVKKNGRKMVEKTEIQMPDYEEVRQKNETFYKFYVYILSRVSRQALDKSDIKSYSITFPVSDLVRDGLYEREETAARAFLSVAKLFRRNTGFTVTSGTAAAVLDPGAKPVSGLEDGSIFSHVSYKNGVITIGLDPDSADRWSLVSAEFAALPMWIYRLSGRAFILADNIFSLARQNTDKVARDEWWTISMSAVQMKLDLPDSEGNPHADRIIKQVEAAVTAIEDVQKESGEICVMMELPDADKAEEFLKEDLRVKICGSLKDYLVVLEKDRQKEQKKSAKREETAKLNAATKAVINAHRKDSEEGDPEKVTKK